MGLVVGIFRAHLVLPWEVLVGWERCGQLRMGLALRVPRTHRGFSMRRRSFSYRRQFRGMQFRGMRATPPRIPVAVLSHTGSHMVSPHTSRAARAGPRPCAQSVHTRTHVQGAICTRVSRSRRCGGSAHHVATRVLCCSWRPAHGGAHSSPPLTRGPRRPQP